VHETSKNVSKSNTKDNKMLKLNNVCVSYGGGDVVKNISFEIGNNENLSVIGPNGCGKTTLLKAIANILPSKGSIEIGGKPVNKMNHKEISSKIAMMSQTSGIYFSYSVFETVMMGRYVHMKNGLFGLPSKDDKDRVLNCLAAVNLLDEKDREITQLSGGQLQRVFLARTIAQEPEIILLDEPTNHLDLKYQIELTEYLRDWSKQDGHMVIGVLHDINLAIRLSENIMIMKDGQAAAFGKTDKTVNRGILRDVYGIDVAEYMKSVLKQWEGL
jgi:iron complex transport system ATP-binding protein